ncbi:MAG: response regulator [Vitreoscilla sp.]|nr:response regulator [Vitreoscilla sp.]MBP6676920.1 response regulator [Vitreoscilla sp.]
MSALLKRVLVVDDDPVVGKSFNRVLSQKGYVVVTAQDGREALSKLQDGDYDVVFTDIRMPGMDGLELAEQVKARKSWTPVVIVTGFGSQANEARAKAAGVSAFLHKPLTPEQIEASALQAMAQPVMPAATHAANVAAVDITQTIAGLHAEVGRGSEENLKKLGLLVAAPFIGLAYFLALPFVGLALLAGMGVKAGAEKFMKAETRAQVWQVAQILAAPFIGLAFVMLAPFVGLAILGGMVLKLIAQRLMTRQTLTFLKNVALFFAAPFIGLAYITLLPLAGLGTLAWIGLRQKNNKAEPQ